MLGVLMLRVEYPLGMGDRKPKKNSSGNSDAHEAKKTKDAADRPMTGPPAPDKLKGKKK
jgi:hypothetical protein